ncbi:MAG: hypothetical protein MUF87_11120 [Anaerolineae bacterium]|jgi:hypothetical protein|nr:hypothetical protein [Anaerolineae bacterium]
MNLNEPDVIFHLYAMPEFGGILMIANHAEAMDLALALAKSRPGVERTEVDDLMITSYIMSEDPHVANQEGDQGPFKYRVYLQDTISPSQFVREFQALLRQQLESHDLVPAIIVE